MIPARPPAFISAPIAPRLALHSCLPPAAPIERGRRCRRPSDPRRWTRACGTRRTRVGGRRCPRPARTRRRSSGSRCAGSPLCPALQRAARVSAARRCCPAGRRERQRPRPAHIVPEQRAVCAAAARDRQVRPGAGLALPVTAQEPAQPKGRRPGLPCARPQQQPLQEPRCPLSGPLLLAPAASPPSSRASPRRQWRRSCSCWPPCCPSWTQRRRWAPLRRCTGC